MEEKKQANIEPLDESDLKEEIPHELFAEKKEDLRTLNKKVHEGGEPELPPPTPEDLEDIPSHLD
jgi:hypothetical protein